MKSKQHSQKKNNYKQSNNKLPCKNRIPNSSLPCVTILRNSGLGSVLNQWWWILCLSAASSEPCGQRHRDYPGERMWIVCSRFAQHEIHVFPGGEKQGIFENGPRNLIRLFSANAFSGLQREGLSKYGMHGKDCPSHEVQVRALRSCCVEPFLQ